MYICTYDYEKSKCKINWSAIKKAESNMCNLHYIQFSDNEDLVLTVLTEK